ncbi:MAG: enoyl-CoA hydratase [Granulosicoccus sp.]|nr:enoyl-CoA hydratase [Granulosicoccus sp.]
MKHSTDDATDLQQAEAPGTNKSHNHGSAAKENPPVLLAETNASGVLTLTLNRPNHYNALSHEMLDALQQAIDSINTDVRVVVIAAKGKAFCAGHDLKEMRANVEEQWQKELFDKCSHFMQSLIKLQQPVVARVQGIAAAAGCQLVANCDLAVASTDSQFGVSGINLGLFCSTPSVALARNVSRKRSFEMLMTGEFIDSAKAVDWGLINKSVTPESLDASVSQLCETICSKPKVAVRTGKKLFYQQIDQPLEAAYEMAATAMACNMMAADVSEGIDAFLEKRPPNWPED